MFISGLHSTSDDRLINLVTNVNQNTKRTKKGSPMSMKNKMFVFRLCSTSDDWPSNLSEKHQPKCKRKKKKKKTTKKAPYAIKK